MKKLNDLKIKIFADGADIEGIRTLYANPLIKGFTTNPTLMRKAGVSNYETFGRDVLSMIPDRPVSLEVFADDVIDSDSFPQLIVHGINYILSNKTISYIRLIGDNYDRKSMGPKCLDSL